MWCVGLCSAGIVLDRGPRVHVSALFAGMRCMGLCKGGVQGPVCMCRHHHSLPRHPHPSNCVQAWYLADGDSAEDISTFVAAPQDLIKRSFTFGA